MLGAIRKDPGRIRQMFAEISPRYDFLNHLLSLNIDRGWRRRAVRELALRPQSRVLDLCTGTADLALELAGAVRGPEGFVVGTDFTPEMLRIGERKRRKAGVERLTLLAADALALPFPDSCFDAVTVAFGIRNVCSLEGCLAEMKRVLRPGGQVAILEFSPPQRGVLRKGFELYFHGALPAIGRLFTGSSAYSYLPRSVGEFPGVERFAQVLSDAGFEAVRWKKLTLGVAVLHLARRPIPGRPGDVLHLDAVPV